MTPIATKDLGINETTGLNERLVVWQITIDSQSEKIVVVYKIQTISPTGIVIAETENMTYERFNSDHNDKFNQLRNSQVGQMITGLIEQDLNEYPNLAQL